MRTPSEGFERKVKHALNKVSKVDRMLGKYVSNDGVGGFVDIGGGRIPADFCGYVPTVGETVWVLFVNGTATILGPAGMRSGIGVVASSPSGNMVTVTTDGGTVRVPYASGLSLSVGQNVRLGSWNDGGFVAAVMSTVPAQIVPPLPPAADGVIYTQTFIPRDSGTYSGSWWTDEVWAKTGHTGAWFYGPTIHNTILDASVILSIRLYVSARSLSFHAPNIGYHSSGTKPAGNVTVAGTAETAVPLSGWVTLPNSIADYLKANVGGIGINAGGDSFFRSIQDDPSSGALEISWRI